MRNILIVLIIYMNISGAYAQLEKKNSNKNMNIDYPGLSVVMNSNPSAEFLFLGPTTSVSRHLMILDNDLVPVFIKKVEVGIVFDFKLQQNGKLTYNIASSSVHSYGMNSSGIVDKQYRTPPDFDLDVRELQVMEDGTYYIFGRDQITIDMSQYVLGGDTAAILIAHTIHHMDADDIELWRWNSFDHYDILDVDTGIDLTTHIIDWTHCNSIDIDFEGNIIISTRNFNEITKISRQNGEIIWRLGGERNQFQFVNDNRGFSRQHDARVMSNGNIALFDNGVYLIPEYSSYVEYAIDELNHTATLIRRYSRNGSIFSPGKGGIQELPNGNILISWDGIQIPFITEINSEDSTVYEVKYHNHVSQYRAKKYAWQTNYFSLQYDSLDFGNVAIGDSAGIEMNLYNSNDQSVIINEIYNTETSFSVNKILPLEIPPDDSVEVTLVFEPTEEGTFSDKINLRFVTDTLLIAQQIFVRGEASIVSEVENKNETYSFFLSQNYPNPFNPNTTIKFSIAETADVTLRIYNALGEKIAELVNETLEAGNHTYDWDATNFASGLYFYRILSGDFTHTKKMILMK